MILGNRHGEKLAGTTALKRVDHGKRHDVVHVVADVGVEDEFDGFGAENGECREKN